MGIKIVACGHILAEPGDWRECAETFLAFESELKAKFSAPRILILDTALPEMNTENVERKLETLTGREREVLNQVAEGMSNKEIAVLLHISERTVKNHLSSIFRKIQVSDRTQAALFAVWNLSDYKTRK